ncbi:alpha-ketoacid dehydrogenase subunit beta [Candidatus Micrarchaeota archaeon]|nr:alpha-ketoacid dehydrogenase subunit beta [Candidatus Micrarchaeota archaeon]MBU1930179.1 alpha-ketoacid dehydrogenase subunit beta [Candidatus Micrarchaeota archaeon]
MTQMNMIQALNSALFHALEKDSSVLLLGEDVGLNGGVFRVTEGLQKKFGEKKVIDTPLSESGIVGSSIGLAIAGFKPVAEIQFSGFIYPAFDQLISHAARMRNRTRGKYSCPLVVRTPCSGGVRALEHHSESTESIFIHTPGLKVVMPSTPNDAKGLLLSAIFDPDPVIFFEPMKLYRQLKQEVKEDFFEIPLGKAKIVKPGEHVSMVSFGTMVPQCIKALELLDKKGISAELIDLRSLSPLDFETIQDSVHKTGRLAIVHEAPRTLGLGAEIAATIAERNVLDLEAPITRITGFDTIMPYYRLENDFIPSSERIAFEVEKIVRF